MNISLNSKTKTVKQVKFVCWLLYLYFASLYIMPYFRVKDIVPETFFVREALAALVISCLLFFLLRVYFCVPGWMLLMFIALFGGIANSESVTTAFITLRTLMQFILVYFFSAVIVKTDRDFLSGYRFFFLIGTVTAGIILLQIVIGPVELLNIYPAFDIGSQRFGNVRLGSLWGNPVATASILLIFLWQIVFSIHRWIFRWIMIIFVCVCIIHTYTITAIIFTVLSIVLILFFRSRMVFRMNFKYMLLISVFLLLSLCPIYFFIQSYELPVVGTKRIAEFLQDDSYYRIFTTWDYAQDAFQMSGWFSYLIGCGFDAAGQAAAMHNQSGFRPHNLFIELAVTMGLLGVIAYAWFLWDLFYRIIKFKANTRIQMRAKGLGIGIIMAFSSSLFTDPHVTQGMMIPAFFLAASLRNYDRMFKDKLIEAKNA